MILFLLLYALYNLVGSVIDLQSVDQPSEPLTRNARYRSAAIQFAFAISLVVCASELHHR